MGSLRKSSGMPRSPARELVEGDRQTLGTIESHGETVILGWKRSRFRSSPIVQLWQLDDWCRRFCGRRRAFDFRKRTVSTIAGI